MVHVEGRKEEQKASSLLVFEYFSVASVVNSPACLATLSPLPPPPATMGFYSFMGVTKVHWVDREVFTAI